ncbi:MAG: hypothetical protein COS92_03150 [Desulfobacterales bacterium CG07_land_8_20_14_0_80_52_14]|nr:MAG: hypothetical protein COS92_03150 [Desulfobacterales bacterium CG07_land_8_20_14_0_80_52_14]
MLNIERKRPKRGCPLMRLLPQSTLRKMTFCDRRLLTALFALILTSVSGALSWASEPFSDFALGYYDPQEQIGHVTFFQKEPDGSGFVESSAAFSQEVIHLVNRNRLGAGLLPFKANTLLNALAQAHSDHMRNTGCFAHQCAGEYSPAERICLSGFGEFGGTQSLSDSGTESGGGGPGPGGGSCFIGEAIAAGYSSPASLVAGWMASPSHYAILMHPKLREIGVGFSAGGSHKTYWTLDAGSQPNVLPVFINFDDSETPVCQVTLSMTNEEVSGFGGIDYAHEVAISNKADLAGAVWEPYSPQKIWVLMEGPGPKTVYVKYRDPEGLEILSMDDILLR